VLTFKISPQKRKKLEDQIKSYWVGALIPETRNFGGREGAGKLCENRLMHEVSGGGRLGRGVGKNLRLACDKLVVEKMEKGEHFTRGGRHTGGG